MTTSRSDLAALLCLLAALPGAGAAQTTVQAAGLNWAVARADWFAIEGRWALDAGLAMRESFSFDPVPFEAICADLLAALSEDPEGLSAPPGLGPEHLFRLSVNILTGEGPAFEVAIPLAVEDGRCRLVAEGDRFVATYPAPLEAWTLDDVTVEGEGGAATALFVPLPGVEDAGSFPVDAACRAVLAERFAPVRDLMRDYRPRVLVVRGRTQGEAGSPLEVLVGGTFDISDGTCRNLPGAEGAEGAGTAGAEPAADGAEAAP